MASVIRKAVVPSAAVAVTTADEVAVPCLISSINPSAMRKI
jgi:hypothetical protein